MVENQSKHVDRNYLSDANGQHKVGKTALKSVSVSENEGNDDSICENGRYRCSIGKFTKSASAERTYERCKRAKDYILPYSTANKQI